MSLSLNDNSTSEEDPCKDRTVVHGTFFFRDAAINVPCGYVFFLSDPLDEIRSGIEICFEPAGSVAGPTRNYQASIFPHNISARRIFKEKSMAAHSLFVDI
jgi:hypothetical protein